MSGNFNDLDDYAYYTGGIPDLNSNKTVNNARSFENADSRSEIYVTNFETTNDETDCRVWMYSTVHVDTLTVVDTGKSMDDFFHWCKLMKITKSKNRVVYIHNLKFTGEFIIAYLLNKGYLALPYKEKMAEGTFQTLISGENEYYMISFCTDKTKRRLFKTTFYDSKKLIPMKLNKIPKSFGIDCKIVEMVDKQRPLGYSPTEDEMNNSYNKCMVVAKALQTAFALGLKRLTIASNALSDFKKIISENRYNYLFPILPERVDEELRNAYRGGFCYLNPKYKNKVIGKGIKLDVNGMYYSIMDKEYLPYGEPIEYSGKYERDESYRRFIQVIRCSFQLKAGGVPFVMIRNNYTFCSEAVESTDFEIVELTLTDIELSLFLKTYDAYEIQYIKGWKFKASNKLFTSYVRKWYKIREDSKINDEIGITTIAKRMLTSLYGSFGKRPKRSMKLPYLDRDGDVSYLGSHDIDTTTEYVPVAIFTTSYARVQLIKSIKKVGDRFIYCDTDSLDLIGTELPEELSIHQTNLGDWKLEHEFKRAKFLGPKCYIQDKADGELKVVVAGMGDRCKKQVTFDNFKRGYVYQHNLRKKRTKDGAILYEDIYELK